MSIISTQDLKRTFKARGKTVEAVRGVDLKVEEGEIFGFLGPNGAGKTTTMRMLGTLLQPTDGTAQVAGFDLRREPHKVREQIGYVGQVGGAELSATGYENLHLQGRLYHLDTAETKRRATALIESLEMTSFASRLAKTYSGGQRRRLELAIGMMHRPRLLFLDEPTTGLDPQSRAHLWEEIRRLREGGTTIFLTTHYLDEADALCDRLAIMDGGLVVGEGSPQALKHKIAGDIITLGFAPHVDALAHVQKQLGQQPFIRETHAIKQSGQVQLYVDRGEENLPTVLRLLDGNGVAIQTIALSRPTLDDVFLRLTGRSLRDLSA